MLRLITDTAQADGLWAAVHRMCHLFAREESALAARLSFLCDRVRQETTLRFLRAMQALPADAAMPSMSSRMSSIALSAPSIVR